MPFDDGEGRPEATAAWLVEVAAAATGVEDSTWLVVVSVATMVVSAEDRNDETAAEETVDDAEEAEAPPEGANVAVRPQSSAAASTWVP